MKTSLKKEKSIKMLFKGTLCCFSILILTAGKCAKSKKGLIRTQEIHRAETGKPTDTDQANKASKEDKSQEPEAATEDHANKAEQACKQAEDYLNQSNQALANARNTKIESKLQALTQKVQEAAKGAKQAANAAEAAAQTAADSNTDDAKQATEYAQTARIAANAAVENVKKVEAIQLGYYDDTHYLGNINQAIRNVEAIPLKSGAPANTTLTEIEKVENKLNALQLGELEKLEQELNQKNNLKNKLTFKAVQNLTQVKRIVELTINNIITSTKTSSNLNELLRSNLNELLRLIEDINTKKNEINNFYTDLKSKTKKDNKKIKEYNKEIISSIEELRSKALEIKNKKKNNNK